MTVTIIRKDADDYYCPGCRGVSLIEIEEDGKRWLACTRRTCEWVGTIERYPERELAPLRTAIEEVMGGERS